jgi:signal transduction histidine kinase
MKTRVMIVEDERIVALNLRQRLTRLGYDITALATSGKQALAEIEREPPDVVLMDVNIDGEMDGIETASCIPERHRLPVIYLTAYSEEATLERGRATKPYGFLLKPFSERELHATIQMVLERQRADSLARENEHRLESLVAERTAELRQQTAERMKAEEALRQAHKMEAIGQLTGGIAHDFNNLLQGILGSLSLLRRDLARGELGRTERYIGAAEASAQRAAGLTHALLAFSRRQPLDPRPVNINQLTQNIADLIRRTVGEAIDVRLALADGLWMTRCDINQLDSAILNLAINARDAMPNGGTLTIETGNTVLDPGTAAPLGIVAGRYVWLAVSDDGIGMSPDVAAQAFEPFFTTKLLGQGTGLGLSMIYGFARQSNGTVKIESEQGRGTTVKLWLPEFSEPTAGEPPEIPALGSARIARDGEVVLVVEDDAAVRHQIVEVLRDGGYGTLEAPDGPSGLEILRSDRRIDLLITDMGLPGLNGRQVAETAREWRPDLKVLFVTGYAENAAAADGFLRPGMALLTKPFALQTLAARIRLMIEV